jgi:dipeptidyl aminopeptidase/acylaminoacyl peptidase
LHPITPIPAHVQLEDLDADHHVIVAKQVLPTGTFLWTSDDSVSNFTLRLSLNTELANIADPKRLLTRYVGADGDSLSGLLVLPVGYTPGKRYPMVTMVYGGTMVTDTIVYASSIRTRSAPSIIRSSRRMAMRYSFRACRSVRKVRRTIR